MKISIQTIPSESQRYPTSGDWIIHSNGDIDIFVSKMNDWRYEVLVAFHELCEVLICKHIGISQESVDEFDIKFEKDRENGLHSKYEEPGDHCDAPYRIPHFISTNCERILALALGVDWYKYESCVENL